MHIKTIILLAIAISNFALATAQEWTKEQLSKANTAKDIAILSPIEKEAIKYINLCRMYPKEFCTIEANNYTGPVSNSANPKFSEYKKTLLKSLNSMKPVGALYFNKECYDNAKCFAKEQGEAGTEGHERIKCPKGNFAECISYGMENAKDIAMQWLIDAGVPNLAHRLNCLNVEFTKIGLSTNAHKKWGTCTVADFIW